MDLVLNGYLTLAGTLVPGVAIAGYFRDENGFVDVAVLSIPIFEPTITPESGVPFQPAV